MALITCHECKKEVSTEAKACPSCGAKVRKPPAPKLNISGKQVMFVFAGLVLIAYFSHMVTRQRESEQAAVEAAKGPAQRAAESKQKAENDKRVLAALATADRIKKSAREPSTINFISLRVSADAKVVCTQYTGRNGFGGVSEEFIIFVAGRRVDTDEWKKYCKGDMYQYKDSHQHVLKNL
jgi:hypothetical protein